VAAIEGIRHSYFSRPARNGENPYVMLVGEGSEDVRPGRRSGLGRSQLGELYDKWQKQRAAARLRPSGPKTGGTTTRFALLVLVADGNIAGGCSTSGLAGKLPGRVGDSPIIGSGLYVDNDVGAAGATGLGEKRDAILAPRF